MKEDKLEAPSHCFANSSPTLTLCQMLYDNIIEKYVQNTANLGI
jgi:hypothetical protein